MARRQCFLVCLSSGNNFIIHSHLIAENCRDQDQTFTLSYSVNEVKRNKRFASMENGLVENEVENLYIKFDKLQSRVSAQQETLRNIVGKVMK